MEITNTQLVNEFIIVSDRAEGTKRKYEAQLTEFFAWLEARSPGLHWSEVQRRDIRQFMAHLQTPARGNKKGYAPALSASSRKNYLASLRSLWKHAIQMEYATTDPTSHIEAPRVVRRRGCVLTKQEIVAFLKADSGRRGEARDRMSAFLLVYTAARAEELRLLRWQDIDFDSHDILLHGKGSKQRVVPIHSSLLYELRRWQHKQQLEAESNPAMSAALSNPETAFVLLSNTGKALAKGTMWKQVKWRAARANIRMHDSSRVKHENRSEVSPHALRRSFATNMLNDGYSLDAIADLLGHANLNTCRDYYAWGSNQRKRDTMKGWKPA